MPELQIKTHPPLKGGISVLTTPQSPKTEPDRCLGFPWARTGLLGATTMASGPGGSTLYPLSRAGDVGVLPVLSVNNVVADGWYSANRS